MARLAIESPNTLIEDAAARKRAAELKHSAWRRPGVTP
jgi:hypothetical protein